MKGSKEDEKVERSKGETGEMRGIEIIREEREEK
jgi:hypothetical protein